MTCAVGTLILISVNPRNLCNQRYAFASLRLLRFLRVSKVLGLLSQFWQFRRLWQFWQFSASRRGKDFSNRLRLTL